jgi:uncharacterized membrane protein YphA (DoxX/SURF4 family)
VKAFFTNKWIALIARVAVAIVFITYAYPKLQAPRAFVKAVGGYNLVPNDLLNLFSILLPGIEITIGIALLIGVFTRASSLIAAILLIIFMGAFATSTILGIEIFDCGCSGGEDGTEQVNPFIFYLRDIAILIGALVAYYGKRILAVDNMIQKSRSAY